MIQVRIKCNIRNIRKIFFILCWIGATQAAFLSRVAVSILSIQRTNVSIKPQKIDTYRFTCIEISRFVLISLSRDKIIHISYHFDLVVGATHH
jgi:hypothetical protein